MHGINEQVQLCSANVCVLLSLVLYSTQELWTTHSSVPLATRLKSLSLAFCHISVTIFIYNHKSHPAWIIMSP